MMKLERYSVILNLRYGKEAMGIPVLYGVGKSPPPPACVKKHERLIQRWTSNILLSSSRDFLSSWKVSRSSSSHNSGRRNNRPHLGTKLVGTDWQNKATKIWVYAHSYKEVTLQRLGGVEPGGGGLPRKSARCSS